MSFSKNEFLQIRNSTAELYEISVCREFRHTEMDGKKYNTKCYNPRKIKSEIVKAFAESEFEKYRIVQDRLYSSDFDKLVSIGDEEVGGDYE